MLYVVSASYDPTLNGIVLKLYNDETEKIEEWTDTDFYAYFLAQEKVDKRRVRVIKEELIEKYDALNDRYVNMWKVSVKTPFDIKATHRMENEWEMNGPPHQNKFFENHIRFFQCYIYDNDIKMGMPYIKDGEKLAFHVDQDAQVRIQEILSAESFKGLTEEEQEIFKKWAMLTEYPAPEYKRASLDIEVLNEEENKIPSSESAILPILTACIATNDGERIALVLIQEGKKFDELPENVTKVMFFSDEKKLLLAIFDVLKNYPFIITFNGDDFDLKYIYNRAIRLGINERDIPIIVRNRIVLINKAIHIDLYKFFFIRAMQIYAFKAKYKNVDLDSVSKALIGKGKIDTGEWVNELSYYDLIKYCMNDAEITLELTTYNNNLVMNLITMLQRIARMPMENVSRKAVSSWIRSFMTYEHRQRNMLIPLPEDIKAVKGKTKSEAIIKGKKYKGAIVFEPKTGTHFNVKVLDFASLYPSIVKVYNLGYSTINCPHEECKSNTIGELPHWMCKKHRALESLLIGALRDLRVFWYKRKAKDKLLDSERRTWYGVAEQSIKVILNASYGVFGAESFVFYCPPLAEEVTAIARHIIKKTAEKAVEMGMDVLYGDTDSIFIKNPPQEKLDELIKWTEAKYGIEFDLDKEYRYACLSNRKKNYFGVFKNGDVDVKGLTGKKKHAPNIIKIAFNNTKKILSEIESPEQMDKGKRKIVQLVKQIYYKFKHRKWENMEDLAFHVTVTKELKEYKKTIPQHVRAAMMLIEEGFQVGAGTNISYIKTVKRVKGKKRWKNISSVKPVSLTEREEVDVGKYVEFLKSTFEQILDPMDINFDEDVLGMARIDQWMPTVKNHRKT